MNDDERRGYNRGYEAGRRRRKREDREGQRQRQQDAFWQRAFLAVLPAAMNANGWTFGDKPINSTVDRVALASEWADTALAKARNKGRI